MKLRIKGNTLRLRLTQSELARFDEEGRVEDTVVFAPGAALHYAIEARGGLAAPRADYDDGRVRIAVPDTLARKWITTDDAGFEVEQPNGSDEPLRILVEKDFACLHRESEEDDVFPNPVAREQSLELR
jgi:hypothetical protein